ncbi:MAG: hypothetical protein WKF31_02590 [Thermoleophilaceae bacterium]
MSCTKWSAGRPPRQPQSATADDPAAAAAHLERQRSQRDRHAHGAPAEHDALGGGLDAIRHASTFDARRRRAVTDS